MRKLFATSALLLIMSVTYLGQSNTPHTVTMVLGSNNATAFTSNGNMGTDGATFYIHWDATYLYLGWSGGKTNYGPSPTSDMYYAAIDTDPAGTNGTSNTIELVGFIPGAQLPDYYVVYENNNAFYGDPVTNGNAFELYNVSGGIWAFSSRTGGNDGVDSRIDFQDSGGEVRLRIAWSSLGSFSPGSSAPIGIVMWTNNGVGNFMWGRVPTDNPSAGNVPIVLTHYFSFSSTGSGVNPSVDGTATALPVELTSFTANKVGDITELNWTTATEINNYGFEVMSSGDNINWTKIGFVEGHGNSNSPKEYSFVVTDNSVAERSLRMDAHGRSYRLKQIDTDGGFEYSDVVEVEGSLNYKLSQNHPNPFNPTTTINFTIPEAAKVNITIYNTLGQVVAELVNQEFGAGNHTVEFNASNYTSGLYFYRLESSNFSKTMKMLLLK